MRKSYRCHENIPYIHITIAGHREFWLGGKIRERVKPGSIQESPDNYGYRTTNACLPGVQGLRCGQDCCAPNLPNQAFMDSNMQEEGERKYDIVSFSRIDKNKTSGCC